MKTSSIILLGLAAARRAVCQEGFYIDPRMADGDYAIEFPYVGRLEEKMFRQIDHLPRSVPIVKRFDPDLNDWLVVENLTTTPPAPPPSSSSSSSSSGRRLGRRAGVGSGELTYVYNEDTKRVESVSHDVFHDGALPLPVDATHCHHGHFYPTLLEDLDPDDYFHSKLAFFNWCAAYGFQRGHVALALKGTVAVYACAYQRRLRTANRCSEGEFLAAERLMNRSCGALGPAAVSMDSRWRKEYGRSFRGDNICGSRNGYDFAAGADEGRFADRRLWHQPSPEQREETRGELEDWLAMAGQDEDGKAALAKEEVRKWLRAAERFEHMFLAGKDTLYRPLAA